MGTLRQCCIPCLKRQSSIVVTSEPDTHISIFRITLSQCLPVMVKNTLLITYGLSVGYPTILLARLSESENEMFNLDDESKSWLASIQMMCLPLGCIMSGIAVTALGRKTSMQVVCIPYVLSFIGFYLSTNMTHIYLTLATIGFFSGLSEAAVLTYVAVITQPHLRGILSSTSTFSVLFGVMLEFILGTYMDWRTLALINCAAPVAAFTLLFTIPESPQWLITKNRLDHARESLAWLRGWTALKFIEEEFQRLIVTEKTIKEDAIIASYFKRDFLVPSALLCFLFFIYNFSGAVAIQTFAVQIFATLETPMDSYHATILMGVSQMLGILPSIILINRLGKRVIVFYSLAVGGISIIIVGCYAHVVDAKYFNTEKSTITNVVSDDTKWIPLVFIALAEFALQGGIRVITWILVGEVFPRRTSAIGSGIAGAIAYIFGFISNKVFLITVANITLPGTFWFSGTLSLGGFVILYFWIPETEGKTLQEITDHFSNKLKLKNIVVRKASSSCVNETIM